LVITSGGPERLTITGPAKLVSRVQTNVVKDTLYITLGGSLLDKIRDSVTTSLTRKKITYHLTIRQLEGIELCGLIHLDTSGLESGKPVIKYFNPLNIPVKVPIPPR
jgi:hypothetical protein